MDTKALFVAVLAAGIVGGFVISDYLVDDEAMEQKAVAATLRDIEKFSLLMSDNHLPST